MVLLLLLYIRKAVPKGMVFFLLFLVFSVLNILFLQGRGRGRHVLHALKRWQHSPQSASEPPISGEC